MKVGISYAVLTIVAYVLEIVFGAATEKGCCHYKTALSGFFASLVPFVLVSLFH
jgi:hypothetical protein